MTEPKFEKPEVNISPSGVAFVRAYDILMSRVGREEIEKISWLSQMRRETVSLREKNRSMRIETERLRRENEALRSIDSEKISKIISACSKNVQKPSESEKLDEATRCKPLNLFEKFVDNNTTDSEKWQVIEDYNLFEAQGGMIGDCAWRNLATQFINENAGFTDNEVTFIMAELYSICCKYLVLKYRRRIEELEQQVEELEEKVEMSESEKDFLLCSYT
jgi:hypothetical protein